MKMDAMVMRRTVPVPVQQPATAESQPVRSTANKVRFSDTTIINEAPNTDTLTVGAAAMTTPHSLPETEAPDIVDNIYLRLKRKQPPTPPPPQHQPQIRHEENDETIRKIQEMLFEMKREIADISRRQNDMFERFMK
jgi:hypothetical protein